MGKPTGFIDYHRVVPPQRPVQQRLDDYREVAGHQSDEETGRQGGRCMDCGIPYCHGMGCPVQNLIPEWNDAVYRQRWFEAYERLEETNNLPEITGRVCPAPCEASCTLSINSAPVAIKHIEKTIIENAFEKGWVTPKPPAFESGKRIAVIGSGPAGLAAAQQLRRAGHGVTVFEKNKKPGGILRYGIPDFKLEKHIIDRRLDQMRAEGIVFETEIVIGEDLSVRYLRRSFDAVVMTLGSEVPRDLPVPGRGLEGIHYAMDYLIHSNRRLSGEIPGDIKMDAGNKVVCVIGGGDTGSDCVGTANRQKAKKVYQFEILPKPTVWDKPWNPSWPYWPSILRTSSSHEEGCERDWAIQTTRFSGRGIQVSRAHFQRVEWVSKQAGSAMTMRPLENSTFSLDVDMVILAMGFIHTDHGRLVTEFGCDLDKKGNIRVGHDYMTSVPGVFSAGDAATGASLVVRAIFHGRKVAESVDRYLREDR